jgi:hypothetical protein
MHGSVELEEPVVVRAGHDVTEGVDLHRILLTGMEGTGLPGESA